MYIKLLLLSQLLAVCSIVVLAHADDDETLDDVTTPAVEITTLPEVVTEAVATAAPEEGLLQLDEGLALDQNASAEPETTVPPSTELPTVPPPTDPPTVPTTTEKPHKLQEHDHPPYPFPFAHPHGLAFNPLTRRWEPTASAEKPSPPKPSSAEYPQYPYSGYPILRSPYSPYGSPLFRPQAPQFPGYGPPPPAGAEKPSDEKPKDDDKKPAEQPSDKPSGPPLGQPIPPSYGYPPFYGSRSPYSPYGSPLFLPHHTQPAQFPGLTPPLPAGAEKPSDDKSKSLEDKDKPKEDDKKPADQPLGPPSGQPIPPGYGYPPLYVVQRRPFLPSYGYAAGPARGYGSPYGYGYGSV